MLPSYRNPTPLFYLLFPVEHLDGSPTTSGRSSKPASDGYWGVVSLRAPSGVRLVELERRHRLSSNMRVYQVIERLR